MNPDWVFRMPAKLHVAYELSLSAHVHEKFTGICESICQHDWVFHMNPDWLDVCHNMALTSHGIGRGVGVNTYKIF